MYAFEFVKPATMAEAVAALRAWADGRTVHA